MFIDYAKIMVSAGRGGNGCKSFRREKFVSKGGPDGGDGGRGGSIIAVGNENMNTLINYRHMHHFKAKNGEHGKGKDQTGASGENSYLQFPLGTIIRVIGEDGKLLTIANITTHGEEIILGKGGRGGRGNARFATSRNKAPRFSEEGKPGESFEFELELKLMADIGLVGFPNAGKSTLLSSFSAARPKIADYEFTTLKPSLGVVQVSDYESFVMADIPGIIDGAHDGKGLGIQFLKHIQRTKILLFLIDINSNDPFEDYQTLKKELHLYDPYLDKKKHIIALTKVDTISEDDKKELVNLLKTEFSEKIYEDILSISSVSSENLKELKMKLFNLLVAYEREN